MPLVSAAATPPVQVAPPITAFAGTGASGNGTTGTATTVALSSPNSVAMDGQGNVYILDAGNLQVRKVDTSGNLTTLILNNLPYSQHNFQAIAFDKASQFLYLSDQLYGYSGGSYGQIYQFAVTQGSDYADLQLTFGAAPASFAPPVCTSQNMGTNASYNFSRGCNPTTVVFGDATGMAVDATGNLYIADGSYYSSVLEVVANGTEVQAIHPYPYSFNGPVGLAIDSTGNLYVSENSNHDIKKVTPSGVLTIFAGGSSAGCATQTDLLGDGCPAADAIFSNGSYGSSSPSGLAADTSGNLYVADPNDSLVRVIGSDGYIRAVTGTAICPTATNPHGDGCPALQSIAASPVGLAVNASGSLFIADESAEEVREIPAGPFRFGALPLPSGSSSQSIYFAFNQPETLSAANIKVVTQGAAGLDFQNIGAAATSCTAGAFAAGDFCALHIRFSPRFPGTRQGAALLYNSSGALLATAWLNGTGNASMLGFNPPIASVLAATGANFQSPTGVALDGSGYLYVADPSSNTVVQLPPGGSTATSLFPPGTLSAPSDVAVDGAGNLYIADTGNNQILELPPSRATSSAASILISSSTLIAGSALNSPRSLAADSSGNLYILDFGNRRVLQLPATGPPQVYLASTDFSPALTSIDSIAIDGSGNLYLADASANQVAAYSASGAATILLASTASIDGQRLSVPNHLSVDGVGNLYVSDSGNHRILQVTPAGQITPSGAASDLLSSSTQIASLSINNPGGLALDGLGDLYAADTGNARILKLDVAASPTLAFGAIAVNTTSAAQSITIRNLGNQPLISSAPGISLSPLPSPFALLTNSSSPCSTPFTLSPGTSCEIAIDDQPTSPVTCSGTSCAATLTDNALGAAATQAIYLAANTSPAQAATLSATLSPSAPIPYGQDVTATITASGDSGHPTPTGNISY
ncbi:MAG: NHL repeat-containing protein, partial [Acidobacteriaceae bacterium]